MTIPRLLNRPDTLKDIGYLTDNVFYAFGRSGSITIRILKFLLFDVTIFLRTLPFGSYISIVYFVSMSLLIKNIIEGGELSRILIRAFHLLIFQQKSWSECLSRFQSYIARAGLTYYEKIQNWSYEWLVYAWTKSSNKVKTEVKKFAKEVIFDNAEEIAKTAVFSAMITTVSQRLMSELGPATFNALSQSDIAKTIIAEMQQNTGNIDRILRHTETIQLCSDAQPQNIKAIDDLTGNVQILSTDIQILSSGVHSLQKALSESVSIIMDAESKGNLQLLENDARLTQKLAEISAQLEYLRSTQSTKQWKEILNTISLSTLALNDIGLPSAITDVFAQFSNTFSSQQNRKRIES